MEAFDFKIEFVKGEENIADPSSRLIEGECDGNFEDAPTPGEIMSFTVEVPKDVEFNKERVTIEELEWQTGKDHTMQAVIQALHSDKWGKELSGYKRVRHEIREREGLLTRMGEIVVPEMLRPKILSAAHKGHPGTKAMKSILKGSVWWPGMLAQADKWVKSCKACTLMSRKDSPMPMQRSQLPTAVWSHLAMDYNGPYQQYGNIMVLLIVDLYSRFLIARPVRTTSFGNIRPVLDDVFDTFGNVESIRTDNGPPFNGAEYTAFHADRK